VGLTIGASSIQLILQNNNRRTSINLGRATERLATGLRINRSSDDPAGLIGAAQLRRDLIDLGAQTRFTSEPRLQTSAVAGAYQKYTLDVNQRLAEDKAVVTAQALSLQEDADYAQESSNLIKSKILNEASIRTIALAQRLRHEGTSLLLDILQ
jgi:flagellin-like hook-associated protein FlgL